MGMAELSTEFIQQSMSHLAGCTVNIDFHAQTESNEQYRALGGAKHSLTNLRERIEDDMWDRLVQLQQKYIDSQNKFLLDNAGLSSLKKRKLAEQQFSAQFLDEACKLLNGNLECFLLRAQCAVVLLAAGCRQESLVRYG